ncbi:hypothetical protein MTO96_026751 [Rhipicephalus appendiculatus]
MVVLSIKKLLIGWRQFDIFEVLLNPAVLCRPFAFLNLCSSHWRHYYYAGAPELISTMERSIHVTKIACSTKMEAAVDAALAAIVSATDTMLWECYTTHLDQEPAGFPPRG